MRTKISGTHLTPHPNSWKENLFISESAIINRYMAEKKLVRFVLNGDYDGARALLDSLLLPEPPMMWSSSGSLP